MGSELAVSLGIRFVCFVATASVFFFVAKVWWPRVRDVKEVVRQKPCASFERTMVGIGERLQAEDVRAEERPLGFQLTRREH